LRNAKQPARISATSYECQKRRQANDRNHDAEHNIHILECCYATNSLYETAHDFYPVTEKKQIFLIKLNMLGYYNQFAYISDMANAALRYLATT